MDIDKASQPLDRMQFQSQLMPIAQNYFVGIVQDDKKTEKEKASQQRAVAAEEGDATGQEQVKLIQRRVIQSDDKDAIRRVKSGQEESSYEDEDWIQLVNFNASDYRSVNQYQRLFSIGDEARHDVSSKDYLDSICAPEVSKETSEDNTHVIRHSDLREAINAEDGALIPEVNKICVLVHGLWILRSELLYSGKVSDARWILLGLFNNSPSAIIRRKDLGALVNLPAAIITNLLAEVAYKLPSVGWQLKFKRDDEFCSSHPDVVKEHTDILATEVNRFRLFKASIYTCSAMSTFGASADTEPKRGKGVDGVRTTVPAAVSSTPSQAKQAKAQAPVVQAGVTLSKTKDLGISKHAAIDVKIRQMIKKIMQDYGVASRDFIHKSVMHHLSEGGYNLFEINIKDAVDAEEVDLEIQSLCVDLHDRYILRSHDAATDETSVKKAEVNNACHVAVGKNPPQTMYQKIMRELAISSGPTWALNVNSPKVLLKVTQWGADSAEINYNFQFVGKDGVKDREKIKEVLAVEINKNRLKSGSLGTADSQDFERRKELLNKDKDLAKLHRDLVLAGIIGEEEFWQSRKVPIWPPFHSNSAANAYDSGISKLPESRTKLFISCRC
ncbi:General transcription factor IIH subunit 1 [Phlyctochytrium bullatum]|nr:General transcription factor IIH subunit 1 [Phlyctochytrium bullatum]